KTSIFAEPMSRLRSVFTSALFDARQTLFVCTKSAQKSLFGSLTLSGSVVGAPSADNLKIHPCIFTLAWLTIPLGMLC
ncbi:hypothetical protein R0J87_19195, partial [Halomonas sp. SIMBA_159]